MKYIDKLLTDFHPAEVVLQRKKMHWFKEQFAERYYCNTFDDWVFAPDFANELLLKQFGTNSLKGFGVEDLEMGIIAAGAVLYYLQDTQHTQTANITRINRVEQDKYVWLDRFTVRNLEIIGSHNDNARTLLDVVDKTLTPMGSRLMRRWILMPLKETEPIEKRLHVVDVLIRDEETRQNLAQNIKIIGDLERLITKVAVGRINPREMQQLKRSLLAVGQVQTICNNSKSEPLIQLSERINPCKLLAERIEREITEDPPAKIEKGDVIANGVNQELDELRSMAGMGKEYLMDLQQKESDATGIPSLRIGFNNIYGYYFEVYNTHKTKVPPEWIRKQTLTNAERYITPELKEYEDKILGAEEKIHSLEIELYNKLIYTITEYVNTIQYDAQIIAQIDCLLSFAEISLKNNYCRPIINTGGVIDIKEGRHPVIETQMTPGNEYISNNVFLDKDTQQIIIVTGPNMSGKSALLRQTALIVLMAQMGCYCPAKSAEIGVVDKIFTRVGASDNISSGESTFMVEMNETASILNNISDNSLVLLDEIGRGTSTYDGISIAWAITEYLHNNKSARPKVLFATHYHELIEMAEQYERIKNYHVSVKEIDGRIIFLRKLMPGGSEHSFGIHVAKIAGMPPSVVNRANSMLEVLEAKNERTISEAEKHTKKAKDTTKKDDLDGFQLSFIQLDDPTLLEIRGKLLDIDIDTLTPIEALLKLNEIKKIVTKN